MPPPSATQIRRRLESFTVIEQRGADFADRLANAHADSARRDIRCCKSGWTPRRSPQTCWPIVRDRLLQAPAVLGLARDGGWWVLGVQSPAMAECLRTVPMSQPDTGELTLKALRDNGIDVAAVELLDDFDVADDVAAVRDACGPDSRFARVSRAAGL